MAFRFFVNCNNSRGLLFSILLFLSFSQISNCQHSDIGSKSRKPCATLYSGPNAQGTSFSLTNNDQSITLVEDQRASETGVTGWNATGSITIEHGCRIKVCERKYFDGACHTLLQGSHSVSDNEKSYLSSIASAECTCEEQCKCSDIHVRKSTCGRAYLNEGCNTCRALYTDFNTTESTIFPERFMDNVKAIRLRKGCTLSIYSEEDFEGDKQVISKETVENYKGTVGSYKCACDDSLYVPRVPPPRPDNYPKLIDIPNSMDEVVKLLGNESYKYHPGLHAARRSYRSGRSSKNAYILLIGSTGAGKSTAINLLFDNNVTKIGDFKSTTSAIHEFRIPVAIDELGIANSELRVIDTPGVGDTRGLAHDAKFLATLDNYLSTHEELKDRKPNVVLIFHKFTDNRFEGEGASFVQMIRGLDIFSKRYADDSYSNVIFVFSHFASATKTEKRRPDGRLQQFKQVIEEYSLYPKPIHLCVAENKANEQEIPMVNGYYKLPNNEYYPRNLFEKLELVTKKGSDPIGLGVFTTAFRNSENFNITNSTFDLLPGNSGKVLKYLSYLSNANYGIADTEVSQRLQTAWEANVPTDLQKKFPMSLPYLQKALNIRNINLMTDVPRTTNEILNLLTSLTNNAATLILLDKGLGIKPPVFPLTIAGYSYNVFKDTPLTNSPFKLGELQQSDIGFMIPSSLTCKLNPGMKEHFNVFEDKGKYLQHRLKSLGIEGIIPLDRFTDEVKPGSNIRSLSFKNDSCSLSATRDFQLFEFVLNDRLDLTPEFENSVRSLSSFNQSDSENVDKWTQFFNSYGTHVVKSIYGGGTIQIRLDSNEPFNEKFAHTLFALVKFAEDMTYDLNEENSTSSSNATTFRDGTSQTMAFIGGNPEYHTGDLGGMSITQANTLLTNWKKSLKFTPAILATEMRLKPISLIVKELGQNYTEEIDRATRLLFNSEIKFVPPTKKKDQVPIDRDATPYLKEMMDLIQKQQDRLLNMTLEMQAREIENERRRQDLEEQRHKERLEWDKIQLEYQKQRDDDARVAAKDREEFEKKITKDKLAHEEKMLKLNLEIQSEMRKATERAHQRSMDMINEINKRPIQVRGGCLKAGTRILMEDWSEMEVENLKVGDIIRDKDLQPTVVLGVVKEFLLNLKFYGFKQNETFFTGNHLFVGPSSEGDQKMKLYAKSTSQFYQNSPLMVHYNVTDMKDGENVDIYKISQEPKQQVILSSTNIDKVYEDSHNYPEDTLIYDVIVDSPTGTYFANGYVCKKLIPPVEKWPNTMSVLFKLMSTPTLEDKLPHLPFTVENIKIFYEIANNIVDTVNNFMNEKRNKGFYGSEQNNETALMTLEDVNVEECISRMFENPIISAAALTMYSRVGPLIAPYLDNINGDGFLNDKQVAFLQHELYNLLIVEVEERLCSSFSVICSD